MSDPLTNIEEREDILASIRRLVADSHIPQPEPRDAETVFTLDKSVGAPSRFAPSSEPMDEPLVLSADHMVEVAPESDADDNEAPFLLGPELAVVETQDDSGPKEEPEWQGGFGDASVPASVNHVADLTLEERIAELEQAVGAEDGEWEPDGSTDLEAETPHEVPQAFTEMAASSHQVDERSGDVDTPASTEGANAPLAQGDSLQSDDIPAPQPRADNVHVLGTLGSRAVTEGVEAPTVEAMAADQIEAVFPEVQDSYDGGSSVPVGEAEFAPAGFDDTSDDAVGDEGGAVDPAEAVEAAIEATPTESPAMPLGAYVDDDELRALVAEVIGEELRGPLGERMTRNIRRLVRREVQRALAMRDLS